jgi:hypothetical protein
MSDASLSWLEQLLSERFGHEWMLQRSDQCISLSLKGEAGGIVFDELEECFTQSRSDLKMGYWSAEAEGWQSVLGGPLPAPGVENLEVPLIEQQGEDHLVHYDILGLVYWMLTRIEEIGRTDLDRHGRFPATSSHAYQFDYLERPVVDEWLQILGQVVQRQWPGIELKRHEFQTLVSHDVDRPSRYGFSSLGVLFRRMMGDLIRRRELRSSVLAPWIRRQSRSTLHPADPYNTFSWIMEQSENKGLISAFYFICGRTDPRFDADYEIEHPAMRRLLREIHARGHEIGLHPSYKTYQNPTAMKQELERLRRVCVEEGIHQAVWGGRMHYLRWEQPTTLKAWEAAKMSYDSTLGYADHAGFRCGTCFEYSAFDPLASKALRLRVRPLIAMEQSILSQEFMGLNGDQSAAEKFDCLRATCRKVRGNFALLWHNSALTRPCEREIYRVALS